MTSPRSTVGAVTTSNIGKKPHAGTESEAEGSASASGYGTDDFVHCKESRAEISQCKLRYF